MEVTLDDVCALVGVQLGRELVAPGDRIVQDLGAESFDVLNLVTAAEERYGVALADDDLPAVETVADFYRLVKERTTA